MVAKEATLFVIRKSSCSKYVYACTSMHVHMFTFKLQLFRVHGIKFAEGPSLCETMQNLITLDAITSKQRRWWKSRKKKQNKKQSGKVSIIESYNCDSTSTSCCCHRRHYCPYLCYCCCRCTDGHEWYAVKTPIIWTKQKIHAKVACATTFSVCRIWYSIRSINYEAYNINESRKQIDLRLLVAFIKHF